METGMREGERKFGNNHDVIVLILRVVSTNQIARMKYVPLFFAMLENRGSRQLWVLPPQPLLLKLQAY